MSFSQSSSMKQMVMDADTHTLPEVIIRDILKRLPVKSLLRFQCVSRHWKTLIKTPAFIADHLHHTSSQYPSLLLTWKSGPPSELYILDCQMQAHKLPRAPLTKSRGCGNVLGSCNGLVCLQSPKKGRSGPSFLLWNPAIREFREIPKAIDVDYKGELFTGFGFSPTINDYKVVMICVPKSGLEVIRVEVYSLTSGTWRGFEYGLLKGIDIDISYNSVTANGAIFWIGFKHVSKDEEETMIVSFDIASEVITLVPIPDEYSDSICSLLVYENKLAIFFHAIIESSEDRVIVLLVMEENAGSCERWSWTKKYTSNPFSWSIVPVLIWKNDIVCKVNERVGRMEHGEVKNKPKITWLDPTSSGFNKLVVHDCNILGINYMESLVPVGGKKLSTIYI